MKKYIPVFGDQGWFERANSTEIFAIVNEGVLRFFNEEAMKSKKVFVDGDGMQEIAMRRIEEIPEPKRWTVEDQKAGLLPPVGVVAAYCVAKSKTPTEITSTWREGDELEIMKDLDEGLFSVFNKRTETCSNLVIDCMLPIETPEERAQRLRSEWVNKAFSLSNSESYVLELQSIYDALLSGELPPVQAKDGA